MRLYVINDLREKEAARIETALKDRGMAASMEHLYWVEVPEDLLSELQKAHLADCGPYSMGLEMIEEFMQGGRAPSSEGPLLALELLVRARSNLRCACIAYATPEQRRFGIEFVDNLLRELDIPV